MRFRRPIARDRSTHTWEDKPEYRERNGGLGACNIGSGKRMICALGGIGCDVDHISIAQLSIRAYEPVGPSAVPEHYVTGTSPAAQLSQTGHGIRNASPERLAELLEVHLVKREQTASPLSGDHAVLDFYYCNQLLREAARRLSGAD